MTEERSGYKHDASDRKLDKSAEAASDAATEHANHARAGHDPDVAKHDDAGKDRLFEGRQQHDEAEKNSEKTRLARDIDHHDHDHDVDDTAADAGSSASAKRKS
ncbi:MAG: hypothetical protein ABI625_13700 [bacterium]